MIRSYTYEVYVDVAGKQEIEGVYPDQDHALARAELLLKQARYAAVAVFKVNAQNIQEKIFEKMCSSTGTRVSISLITEAFPCLTALDTYSFKARHTLLRLLRGYFDEQLVIPLELLHNYGLLRYLEKDAMLFGQGINCLSNQQSKALKVSPVDRYNTLVGFFREITEFAKNPDTLDAYTNSLAQGGLSNLTAMVINSLPSGEQDRAITYAFSKYLGEARDWNLKLKLAGELFEEDIEEKDFIILDELFAEIIGGTEPIRAAIGYAPDQAAALESIIAVAEGAWNSRLPGTPAFQKLSDIISYHPLPNVRSALLSRVSGSLAGKSALTKSGRAGDANAIQSLLPKLIEFDGFMGGVSMSDAVTRRVKIAMGRGSSDLSFEDTVDVVGQYLSTTPAQIGYLLDLLHSEFGKPNGIFIANSLSVLFDTVSCLDELTLKSGGGGSSGQVKDQLQRRILRSGLPRKTIEELVAKLDQIPAARSNEPLASGNDRTVLRYFNDSGAANNVSLILRTAGAGNDLVINKDNKKITIGRVPGCDVVMPYNCVSRLHAIISCDSDGFSITDSSSNGTFIIKNGSQTLTVHGSREKLTGTGKLGIGHDPGRETPDLSLILIFEVK